MPRISASTTLTSLPEGEKGEKGPALRVQLWDDVEDGFLFENGSEGSTYLDVVVFNKNFYSCKTSHSKDSSVTPAAGVASDLWVGTSAFDLLATKLFFAEYALIENLGVESFEMYARDSSGNIIKNADGTNKVVARMKDGVIEFNTGIFKNIKVVGSLRNPFAYVGGSFETDYNDNVVMISTGSGWTNAYSLPWDVGQSGRRIMIVNYKWGDSEADGQGAISAPSGKYFYEDGIARSSLQFSREAVELMGYGTPTQFYGWIVTKRTDLMTRYKYGKGLKALAFGSVTSSGTLTYKTFDGSILSASKASGVDGQYTITMPSSWFAAAADCMVLLTGLGYVENSTSCPVRATLVSRTTTQFVVRTADDETPNNGAFEFVIINKNDWI